MTSEDPLFDLTRPAQWRNGIIFASPHSGRCFPAWFQPQTLLSTEVLRSSEDAFVDQLIAPATGFGAVVLTARVPRSLVDLNRGADDFDPLVVEGIAERKLSPRIMAGLGVIPRVVSQGRAIYRRPMSRAEAERRVAQYWQPYHQTLSALIDEACTTFGGAILIDAHSMPRDALAHLPAPRPEIVLGDRNGGSAAPRVTNAVSDAIAAEGFRLRRNSPFAGAYIAATYGRPTRDVHVVQLEVDRSLYMDERRLERRADYESFAARITRLIARLTEISPTEKKNGRGLPLAAE